MSGSQLVSQGSLNLLRASVTIPSFTNLNVTASFLHKGMIKLSFTGEIVIYDMTATGAVTSQQPYQIAEVEMELIKAQPLANAYKQQLESNALLGNISVRGDAAPLGVYALANCSIASMRPMEFSGQHAVFPIVLKGIYYINSSLFV